MTVKMISYIFVTNKKPSLRRIRTKFSYKSHSLRIRHTLLNLLGTARRNSHDLKKYLRCNTPVKSHLLPLLEFALGLAQSCQW